MDEAEQAEALRTRVAAQNDELLRLRREVSELRALQEASPSDSLGDEADLRSRFAINRLIFQNKLQQAEAKEKERAAEVARSRLTAFQRQHVRRKGQLWAEQLLRRMFAAWVTVVAGSQRAHALEHAVSATDLFNASEKTSLARARELARLSALEMRRLESSQRAAGALVEACVRLQGAQRVLSRESAKLPFRMVGKSHVEALATAREEIQQVTQAIFAVVDRDLLWVTGTDQGDTVEQAPAVIEEGEAGDGAKSDDQGSEGAGKTPLAALPPTQHGGGSTSVLAPPAKAPETGGQGMSCTITLRVLASDPWPRVEVAVEVCASAAGAESAVESKGARGKISLNNPLSLSLPRDPTGQRAQRRSRSEGSIWAPGATLRRAL
mmetsp:Transcript_7326/g.21530  ORF Transcript_7326/g.21530 Transcript_7326/m.21530 type:complete len:381 (+) Transcript_7326:44-1186(+)